MALITLGLNHTTAPVNVRERLSFGPDIVVAALRSLLALPGINEGVILSTCNRTEIYCSADPESKDLLTRWAAEFHGLDPAVVAPYLYIHKDSDTIHHILSVASGLDSMVLGEPQVLGQVKDAYRTAVESGASGKMLGKLFQHSFSTAKQVRTDTSIGDSPVSVAFAAVSLAKQIFTDLSTQSALLIGAGETIELAARHLHQNGIKQIIVANRTVVKARELAAQFGGYAISLSEIQNHLPEADIVIASTASPLPVLGKGTVETALRKRKHQPIFMVDIAVPRDIEAEVGELQDIYLYTVDDLEEVIQENLRSRQDAAEQAKEIIDFQTEEFVAWMRSLDAVDVIQSYRRQAEEIRNEILEKARAQVAKGKPVDDALNFLAHTLTNKLLHTPSSQLRQAGANGQQELLEAANTLFKLDNQKSSK